MVMYRRDVKHIIVKGYSNDDQRRKVFKIFKVGVQRTKSKINVPPQTRKVYMSIKLGWSFWKFQAFLSLQARSITHVFWT